MDTGESTANQPKKDPYIGKVIDKYEILEPLGKGGMGLIYKAQHRRIKRLAALKLLGARQLNDEVSIRRLEREATAMGNLQHPNIATMYDFGMTEDGTPYIVLELIKGQNLKESFKELGRIDPHSTLHIFRQIADAMEYAHSQGVIHRDLKPENIMLTAETDNELVKILDFGIARSTEESMLLTKTGQIIGSAAYMSPEQCSGKKPVDYRTDIYALGVIMYELLSGKLPYKGDTFLETIYLKTTEHPSPFPDHLKKIEHLESLVLRCLLVEPADRPQSMKEVNLELKAIMDQAKSKGTFEIEAPQVLTGSQQRMTVPDQTFEAQSTVKVSPKEDAETKTETQTSKHVKDTSSVAATLNEVDIQKSPKTKLALLAVAILSIVSALVFGVLNMLNPASDVNVKDTKMPAISPAQKTPTTDTFKNLGEKPQSGSSIGADVLMGGKTIEPVKSKKVSTPKSKPRTKPSYTPRRRTVTTTPSPPVKQAPKSAPPIVRSEPSPPVATSSPSPAPTPAPKTTKKPVRAKEPSYYKRQYKKYKNAGKKIDKSIRKFFRKF